jgi:hypothetical protein
MKDGKDAANLPNKGNAPIRDTTPPQVASRLQITGTPAAATSSSKSGFPIAKAKVSSQTSEYAPISERDETLGRTTLKPPQAAVIDAAFNQRAGLKQALTTNLAPAAAASAIVVARAKTAFEKFNPSQYSETELANRNHVAVATDPSEMLNSVVKRYVDSGSASTRAGAMTIRADGDLATIKNGNVIPLDSLLDYLGAQQTRSYSFAASSALAACYAQSQAQALVASIGADPSGGGDNGDEPKPVAAKDVTQIVSDTVNLQMATATSPEMKLSYAVIPNDSGSGQTDLLQTFELRPDPTNVTSYHDFTTLQIAFEHVWTQMFDSQLASVGMQLYQEYVHLKDLSGSAAPDPTIDTLDDLAGLMTEIRSLSQFVQITTPSTLGVTNSDAPASADSVGNDLAQGAAAVLTGGVSVLFEAAFNAFATSGQKPLIAWNDLKTGDPLPSHSDHIVASFEYSVVQAGFVQFALKTDTDSSLKQVAFQYWDQASNKFSNLFSASNKNMGSTNDPDGYKDTSPSIPLNLIQTGCFEFDSQEDPVGLTGRYTLGNLSEQLVDGSRVTFYWSGAK